MPTTRPGLRLNEEGVCSACVWQSEKRSIDWQSREDELKLIANWARAESKSKWQCVLGVSGGKDSTWQAMYCREILGLNPLLVQYACSDGTDLGRRNLENLVELGFDLISVQPNPKVACHLAKRSFYEYGNIIKYSEYALFATPFRTAMLYDVPLVFFGENPALEAGDTNASVHGWDATSIIHNNTLSGATTDIWLDEFVQPKDLLPYKFPTPSDLEEWGGKGIFMGFYAPWSGHANGVYAIQNGLQCHDSAPDDLGNIYGHTALDCDNTIVNAMLKHIKLGFGSTTEFACYDIRNNRITRDEGIALVERFDGLCADRFIEGFCRWIEIDADEFWRVANSYRGPMWGRQSDGSWILKEPIWEQHPPPNSIDVDALIERLDTRKIASSIAPLSVGSIHR